MINALDVIPAPGKGVLARYLGVVLLAVPPPDAPDGASALLEVARRAAETGPFPGESLVRRLAGLLADESASLPPFCAIADTETGALILVRGDLDVAAIADGREVVVSGANALTWVDQVVEGRLTVVRAGPRLNLPDDAALRREPSLPEGVVPAGGFVLIPAAGASSDPPRRPLDLGSPEQFKSVLLTESVAPVDRGPLPLATELSSPAPEVRSDGVMVQGYVCSRGHFNDPSNLYCAVCGISMAQRTQVAVDGVRPTLGFLVFDDGSIFSLDADYVVGRDPEGDSRLAEGARALVLDDAGHTVSRVHAEIRLEGWQVRLLDRDSTNGTFTAVDQSPRWRRLDPGQSEYLHPGSRIAFGHRTCRFESPHGHRNG